MKHLKHILSFLIIFASAMTMSAQVPAYVPTNGLAGWWPFTGSANDLSGNGNNGTVSGATLTADRFGTIGAAYKFNGTSDHISVPSSTSINFGTGSYAVNVWVKLVNDYSSNIDVHGIVTKSVPTGGTPPLDGWQFMTKSNFMYSEFASNGTTCIYLGNTSLYNPSWHMMTWVVDRPTSTHFYYLDGAFTFSINCTQNGSISNNYPLRFGAEREFISICRFGGFIDDIGMWNRTLSACEITQLFTSTPSFLNATSTTTAICKGQFANLSVSGASTYTWSNSFQTPNIVVSPSLTTVYSVSGTNSGGCIETKTFQLSVFPNPTLTTSASNTVICKGDYNIISASGASTYTWNTGATSASFAISPTVASPLNYSVTGTAANGCKNTSTLKILVEACTTISALVQAEEDVSILPNPNNGEFTIRAKQAVDLKICDEMGRLVKEIQLDEQNNFEITVSGINKGIYFASGNFKGKKIQLKIIVNSTKP
jgi:hypothetical protein